MPPMTDAAREAEGRELQQLRSLETAIRVLMDKKLSRRARDSTGGALKFRKTQWGRVHNSLRRLDKLRALASPVNNPTPQPQEGA